MTNASTTNNQTRAVLTTFFKFLLSFIQFIIALNNRTIQCDGLILQCISFVLNNWSTPADTSILHAIQSTLNSPVKSMTSGLNLCGAQVGLLKEPTTSTAKYKKYWRFKSSSMWRSNSELLPQRHSLTLRTSNLAALRAMNSHRLCSMSDNDNNVQVTYTRVGTLIVATIYLQLIQNRYMFRSFTVLQCSHQHCVQPVASDVEVVGYL